jgi:hypothetical protein
MQKGTLWIAVYSEKSARHRQPGHLDAFGLLDFRDCSLVGFVISMFFV